jgi:hypothetical protein
MTERTESQGFYEMLWDCDHCDTKGLLGKSQRHCPNCGAPQSAIKRYFPSPEQQQAVQGHVYEGADHNCPACNAPMGAKAKNCTQCGSPMDGSKVVADIVQKAAAVKPKRKIWPYVLIGIALFIFLIWFFFIRTKSASSEVTGHRWERTVAIEEFKEVAQQKWRDEVDIDAYNTSCVQKQRSTKQRQDGEDCHTEKIDKKDGTFEQVKKCSPHMVSDPVNDDWCTYNVKRWTKVDEMKTTGTGMTPAWPANPPPKDTAQTLGARRSGAQDEKLYVDLGKLGACAVSEAMWKKLADGQKVKLDVRARSGEPVCDTIQPK